MDDKDRVFARVKDDSPEASDRRELLTIRRRTGATGSRVVEVVHVRAGGAIKERPRRIDTHVRAAFPGGVAYVWHAGVHARTVIDSLEAAGFAIRSQIIWAKPRFVLGRRDYHWQHEPCLYAVCKGATGHWQGARDQTTLWSIGFGGDEDAETIHGAQKPVECMRRPIINNSAVGDAV